MKTNKQQTNKQTDSNKQDYYSLTAAGQYKQSKIILTLQYTSPWVLLSN